MSNKTDNNELFKKLFSYINYIELLKVAVKDAPEPVIITSSHLEGENGPEIIFANAAFTKNTGYSFEEVVGKTPRILQGTLTQKLFLKELKTTLKNKEVFIGETVNYRKDGSFYNVRLVISPIYDQHGVLSNYIGLHQILN